MTRRTQFRILVAVTIAWVAWAGLSLTGGAEPFMLRVVDDTGSPISQAVVSVGDRQLGLTSAEGLVEIDSTKGPLEVSARGHVPATVGVAALAADTVDIVLKARVLQGRIVDPHGEPVSDVVIQAGSGSGRSGEDGRFVTRAAEPGVITVTRPAWEPVTFEWEGGPAETEVIMHPLMVKAVHISGEAVEERFDEFVDMARSTELNALMVDLKDESGQVLYESEVQTVDEVGAGADMYDLDRVVRVAAEENLHLIGRLVAFQDPIAALNLPAMAVMDDATGAPFTSNGQYFLDPTDADARDYALDLAVEACRTGVDEIQFDYVRFPDSRPESVRFDAGVTADVRTQSIGDFLTSAVDALHPLGCAVAADVFGFVTTVEDDGGIGQHWVEITNEVDVASPMLYPSHYDAGWFGYEEPNQHPANVVDAALSDAMSRLSRQVIVRPWLQDFGYRADDVRAQIEVAESHGLGWMLWNAFSNVSTGALQPEGS